LFDQFLEQHADAEFQRGEAFAVGTLRPRDLNLHRLSFKKHRAVCFSRVALFGTKQRVTSHMSERKRGRDSNTGSKVATQLDQVDLEAEDV